MINALLYIRLKQIYRGFIGIGIIRAIFLSALIGFAGVVIYVNSKDQITSKYLSGGFLLLITLIHLKRNDILFLKTHFSNYKILILIEYIVLFIPAIIIFLIHNQWVSLFILCGLFMIVQLEINTKFSSLNTKLQALIPADSFEWKAGVRRYLYIIVPVWCISIITSFFVASVPVAIFILGVLVLNFFETSESYQILMSYELNSKHLLQLKLKRQLQLFSFVALPLIGMFLIFHYDKWYITVAEYIIFCILYVYIIMLKYSFYEPNKKSKATQLYSFVGVLGCIIPVLIPMVLLLATWFYYKSINNLNFYLDDYN